MFQTALLEGQGAAPGAAGVTVSTISEDQTPGRRVHDPKHPQADADGYVTYSNVNAVEEMVNMISASRSYQNNVEVMNTAKSLLHEDLADGPAERADTQEPHHGRHRTRRACERRQRHLDARLRPAGDATTPAAPTAS